MPITSDETELERVRGWIKLAKFITSLLEHAQAHLEEVAEDVEEVEVGAFVPAPPRVPAAGPDMAAPDPKQRAMAAFQAAGYGQAPQEAKAPQGRTFVTPGLRAAIVEAARRRPKPTIAVLAEEFDVSTATISRILRQRYQEQQEPWDGEK